jgi:hypothetical protein
VLVAVAEAVARQVVRDGDQHTDRGAVSHGSAVPEQHLLRRLGDARSDARLGLLEARLAGADR